MKRRMFCLVSLFLLSAMLLLGPTVAAQTPDHIAKFSPSSSLVDSVITEDFLSGKIRIGTNPAPGTLLGDLNVFGSPVRILGQLTTLSGAEYVDFMARNTPFNTDIGGMRIQRDNITGDVDTLLLAAPSGFSASEMMRIHGNGTVFIGRTSPITSNEVFGVSGTAGSGSYTGMYIEGTDSSSLPFYGYATNGTAQAWHYFDGGSGQWRLNNGGDRIAVLNTGEVGIGTTAPDQLLSVNGDASKIGGGSWQVFSDERLKTIHGSFDAGLSEVLKLRPIRYRYNKDNPLDIRDEGEHIGLSAQEVQKLIPEAVTENRKGYLMLNNDPVLWAMLNAIKEQQRVIEGLKKKASEIDELKAQLGEVGELRAQVSNLQSLLWTVPAQHPEESASDYVVTSRR